jgi:hypothetical protein
VSRLHAPRLGEFETEVVLPCRVEYRIESDGELHITAIVPRSGALPDGALVRFGALPPRERRCLETEAAAVAEAADADLKTAQALERHEARLPVD